MSYESKYKDFFDAIRAMSKHDLLVWNFEPTWVWRTIRSRVVDLGAETEFVLRVYLHKGKLFVIRFE